MIIGRGGALHAGIRFWRWVGAAMLVAAAVLTVCQAAQFSREDQSRSAAEHEKTGRDIYYLWIEGARILNGENPYDRVLAGDMRRNDKYATHLPGFYLLSALTQALGFKDHVTWVVAWRFVFLLCDLAIGLLILQICRGHGLELVGIVGAIMWLLNRWTFFVLRVAHIDFLPLLCLLLSLHLFGRRRDASLLLLGMSLALKHVGALLVPVYVVWIWQSSRQRSPSRLARAALLVALVPAVVSLPFLVWGAEGFVKSIVFSLTRNPDGFGAPPSFDAIMGLRGLPARLPMLALFVLSCALAASGTIGRYTTCLIVMITLVDFNAVLFGQYVAWMVPFVPLSICDAHRDREEGVDRIT